MRSKAARLRDPPPWRCFWQLPLDFLYVYLVDLDLVDPNIVDLDIIEPYTENLDEVDLDLSGS